MKTFNKKVSFILILCIVALAGTNAWAQEKETKVRNSEKKELKEGKKQAKTKKEKKEAEAKQKQQSPEQKAKADNQNTGNAYGKDKGQLQKKEFGQSQAEKAKLNKEEDKAGAPKAGKKTKKAENKK